jgi:uncharacterized RDD family membrane protein YckC
MGSGRGGTSTPLDLPLFEASPDDRPLVVPGGAPRPPLAVRRGTGEGARLRQTSASELRTPESRLDPDWRQRDLSSEPITAGPADIPLADPRWGGPDVNDVEPVVSQPSPVEVDARRDTRATDDDRDERLAPLGHRVFAGLIDLALIAAIHALVIALTLYVTGLDTSQVARLPLVPLGTFLLLLAGGYLAIFTQLGGQTVGKMAAGVKVVGRDGGPVPFGHAVLRAIVQVVTVPLAGLGFLPALIGPERRALYDRVAHTEVVVVGHERPRRDSLPS